MEKKRLAPFIVSLFPHNYQELHYIEPFFGGGAVLFHKEKSKLESINDLDLAVFSLWKVLKERPKEFEEKLVNMLCHEQIVIHARDFLQIRTHRNKNRGEIEGDELDIAFYKLVSIMLSYTQAGRYFSFAKNPNAPGKAERIENFKESIGEIFERLKNVQIFNRDAIELIKSLDSEEAIYYIDPPYVDARQDAYAFKYFMEDFNNLTGVLKDIKGKFILSYYRVEGMSLDPNWTTITKTVKCLAGNQNYEGTKENSEREEVLTMNYDPKSVASQGSLF